MRVRTAEWDQTFKKYMALSKRDLPTALNTKGFFISRRATVETPKAKLGKLDSATELILAKVINASRAAKGEKGLFGQELKKAVHDKWAARKRSVAFLKSGFLPAIRRFEQAVDPRYRRGAPRQDRTAKQLGKPKGMAIPATAHSWRCKAVFENSAIAERDNKEALQRYAGPALRTAFDKEVQSMRDYIEKKMRQTAKSCGIKTN